MLLKFFLSNKVHKLLDDQKGRISSNATAIYEFSKLRIKLGFVKNEPRDKTFCVCQASSNIEDTVESSDARVRDRSGLLSPICLKLDDVELLLFVFLYKREVDSSPVCSSMDFGDCVRSGSKFCPSIPENNSKSNGLNCFSKR